MLTKDQIITAAKGIALQHKIPPAIFLGLIEQESAFNTFSMRFEPAFHVRYEGTVLDTEHVARATSYGLCQVMGQTARELGYNGPFLSALCDEITGMTYGAKKLANCFSNNRSSSEALLHYNGGSNKLYPVQVLEKSKKYEA